MAILPNPYFPLLVDDQAEVIRMFHELMHEWEDAGRPLAVATNRPRGSRDGGGDSRFHGDEPGLE